MIQTKTEQKILHPRHVLTDSREEIIYFRGRNNDGNNYKLNK